MPALNFSKVIVELERDEGLRRVVYDDATGAPLKPGDILKGHPTIGIGRALDVNGITESEARTLLENDIAKVCDDLDRNIPGWRDWTDARQRALVNMVFNMGIGGVLKFSDMLANMKAGHWDLAALDAMDSVWAKQVGERAMRIAKMIKEG